MDTEKAPNIHNHCPECKSYKPGPEVVLSLKDRLVKRCPECGHKWSVAKGDDWAHPERGGAEETVPERMVSNKGYVTTNRGPGSLL